MTALYIGPEAAVPESERALFDSLDLVPVAEDTSELKLEVSDYEALVGLKIVIGDYVGRLRSTETGELPPVAREVSNKLTDEIVHVQDGDHPEDEPFVLELNAEEAGVVTAALTALVKKPVMPEQTEVDPYEWLYTKDAPNAPETTGHSASVTPVRFRLHTDE